MNYVLDGILIIICLAFLLGGAQRGPLAEGLTQAAILLGYVLMTAWGNLWGTDLVEAVSLGDPAVGRLLVLLALLLAPVLLIGYGGAFLLPALRPMRWWQRLLGALLGAANGAALAAFALRGWFNVMNPAATMTLLTDPVTRFFLEWAGWWPLLLLGLGAGAVVAGLATGAARPPRRIAPPSTAPVGPLAPASPDPARPTLAAPLYGGPVAPPPVTERPTVAPTPPAPVMPARPVTNGTSASGSGKRCLTCGKALPPGAAFCTNCGTPVEA